jgi:hypothetical protein
MSQSDRNIWGAWAAWAGVAVAILGVLATIGGVKYSRDGCLLCSSTPAASSEPFAAFPVTMTGEWQGTYRETDTTKLVSVDLTVPAGAHEATIEYLGSGCSGVLDAVSVNGATVTARESITHNNGCTPTGQWEFTVKTNGTLAGSYVPDGRNYVATATLTRQG